MILVSFFTDNWLYPQYARRLCEQCDSYGLQHDIRKLESRGDWSLNTQLKARFVRSMLEEYTEIAWVDVDSAILLKPDLFKRSMPADMMLMPHTTLPRHWHVGVMCLRRTPEVLRFVDAWVSEVSLSGGTDEAAFERAWTDSSPRVTYRRLPAEYHALPTKGCYAKSAIIGMGLSMDETKMAMKARQAGKGA